MIRLPTWSIPRVEINPEFKPKHRVSGENVGRRLQRIQIQSTWRWVVYNKPKDVR